MHIVGIVTGKHFIEEQWKLLSFVGILKMVLCELRVFSLKHAFESYRLSLAIV